MDSPNACYQSTVSSVNKAHLRKRCARFLPDLSTASVKKLNETFPRFMSRYWRQRIEKARTMKASVTQKMLHSTEGYRLLLLENVRDEMLTELAAYLLARPEEQETLKLFELEATRTADADDGNTASI